MINPARDKSNNMTQEEFKNQLKSIPNLELAKKAHLILSKLCSTGGRSFIMTIPPRIDDTDMIIGELISRLEYSDQQQSEIKRVIAKWVQITAIVKTKKDHKLIAEFLSDLRGLIK